MAHVIPRPDVIDADEMGMSGIEMGSTRYAVEHDGGSKSDVESVITYFATATRRRPVEYDGS